MSGHLGDPLLLSEITKKSCGIAGDNGICGNILGDDAARTNDGVFANYDVWKNGGTGADGSAFLYNGSLDDPILVGLQFAVGRNGSRIAVVDERDAVADKDAVFDIHAFTNKGVTGDLAVLANLRVFLYLDKGANFCVVPDEAAIEINESRQPHSLSELYIRCNREEITHK